MLVGSTHMTRDTVIFAFIKGRRWRTVNVVSTAASKESEMSRQPPTASLTQPAVSKSQQSKIEVLDGRRRADFFDRIECSAVQGKQGLDSRDVRIRVALEPMVRADEGKLSRLNKLLPKSIANRLRNHCTSGEMALYLGGKQGLYFGGRDCTSEEETLYFGGRSIVPRGKNCCTSGEIGSV